MTDDRMVRMRDVFKKSKNIIFLGFGFDMTNLSVLFDSFNDTNKLLDKVNFENKVLYTTYMNPEDKELIKQFENKYNVKLNLLNKEIMDVNDLIKMINWVD